MNTIDYINNRAFTDRSYAFAPQVAQAEPGRPVWEFIPMDTGLIEKAIAVKPGLREAAVASGDKFVEDRGMKQELFSLGCQICDMEIAAIARVCWLNRVPCLSIKCISDTFEGGSGDFLTNVERSAVQAFGVLKAILLD